MVALAELSARIDKAKRWGYKWVHIEITPTGQDENKACVVVRKLP